MSGIVIEGTNDSVVIASNMFDSDAEQGIHCNSATVEGLVISANAFEGSAVLITDGDVDSVIVGNHIRAAETGMHFDTDNGRHVVSGNWIQATQDGILIENGSTGSGISRGQFIGNTIFEPGTATDNTYDGISVEGGADNNTFADNEIIAPSAGNQPAYGINIASTVSTNVVVGNRFGSTGNYGTDALNASTSQVITYPGTTGYGDNFT